MTRVHFSPSLFLVCSALVSGSCARPSPKDTVAVPIVSDIQRTFDSIRLGDSKSLMSVLAPEEIQKHSLTEPKLKKLLELFNTATESLEPGLLVFEGDSNVGSGSIAFKKNQITSSILTVGFYKEGGSTKGAFVIYGLVLATAMAASHGNQIVLNSKSAVVQSQIDGLVQIQPILKSFGLDRIANISPDSPTRSIEEELATLRARLQMLKSRN